MKRFPLALIPLLPIFAGCSTLESLENRVSCSADGKHAYINSLYGPIGVTSKIAAADTKVICKPKEN